MIKIIDYGSGNIRAIKNIYKRLNIECETVVRADELKEAKKLILPGVGAFDDSMEKLNSSGIREVLNELVLEKEVPILGICVGMQIMAKSSEEGELPGLGWVDAKVNKFDEENLKFKPKLPHMGWNQIEVLRESPLLNAIDCKVGFYFLHSYYIDCVDEAVALTATNYGKRFVSSFSKNNIYGFQFHPEKSHSNGVSLLKNFAEL